MPPYVTTGWVVVGGEVVVVVVGKIGTGVGYVVLVARADATSADEVVDVMVSVVGHEADGEGIMGDVNGSKADVLFAAGYSLATTTPMSAAAPEAAMRGCRGQTYPRMGASSRLGGMEVSGLLDLCRWHCAVDTSPSKGLRVPERRPKEPYPRRDRQNRDSGHSLTL